MYKKTIVFLSVLLVFFTISFFLTEKLTEEKDIDRAIEKYTVMVDELNDQLRDAEEQLDNIKKEYNDQLDKVSFDSESLNDFMERYEQDLESWAGYCGSASVQGQGMILTLDDANIKSESGISFIIHDINLIDIVNVLKSAGAQAISINDQRLTQSSQILCVGPAISVNGNSLFAPYTIKAIGDGETMKTVLLQSNIYLTLDSQNIIMDIVLDDGIMIPGKK